MAGKLNEAQAKLLRAMWVETTQWTEEVQDAALGEDVARLLANYRALAASTARQIERLEALGAEIVAEAAGRYGDGD